MTFRIYILFAMLSLLLAGVWGDSIIRTKPLRKIERELYLVKARINFMEQQGGQGVKVDTEKRETGVWRCNRD